MLELFFVAAVCGIFLQFFTKNIYVTAALGFVGYVALSIYQEFFVPYAGGGASFWPIDIVFAGPAAAMGCAFGAVVSVKLLGAGNASQAGEKK